MFNWVRQAREDRDITAAVHSGPPYVSRVVELTDLLQTEYASKRIKRGHA
jgi:hypothetical protein